MAYRLNLEREAVRVAGAAGVRLRPGDPACADPEPGEGPEAVVERLARSLASDHPDVLLRLGDARGAETFDRLVRQAVAAEQRLLAEERQEVVQGLLARFLGLGRLQPLFRDPDVSEILVNAPDDVSVDRGGRVVPAGIAFRDEEEVYGLARRLAEQAGVELSEAVPHAFFAWPDGSRVRIFLPPLSLGTALMIRKAHARRPLDRDDLIRRGTASDELFRLLDVAVRGRLTVLVTGRPSAGKTTLLIEMVRMVPAWERLGLLELVREIPVERRNVLSLQALDRPRRPVRMSDLVAWRLHARLDRIVVGEVLDAEGVDLLHSALSGDDGLLGTIHATAPETLPERFYFMARRAGRGEDLADVRHLVHQAVDLVVHMDRLPDGTRVVAKVVELQPLGGFRTLFARSASGLVRRAGLSAERVERVAARGVEVPQDLAEAPPE